MSSESRIKSLLARYMYRNKMHRNKDVRKLGLDDHDASSLNHRKLVLNIKALAGCMLMFRVKIQSFLRDPRAIVVSMLCSWMRNEKKVVIKHERRNHRMSVAAKS